MSAYANRAGWAKIATVSPLLYSIRMRSCVFFVVAIGTADEKAMKH